MQQSWCTQRNFRFALVLHFHFHCLQTDSCTVRETGFKCHGWRNSVSLRLSPNFFYYRGWGLSIICYYVITIKGNLVPSKGTKSVTFHSFFKFLLSTPIFLYIHENEYKSALVFWFTALRELIIMSVLTETVMVEVFLVFCGFFSILLKEM